MKTTEKVRENRLRYKAQRLGLILRKSRARLYAINNLGEYMLLDRDRNCVVAGERFGLTLDDIADYLEQYEKQLRAEARNIT